MTPHISAKPGEIAKTVIMPGDPLRAKNFAEKYLDNPVLVNEVRNMLMYTGTYKGKPLSICASGMGCGSMGIYSWELFDVYGVETIIRVGTCGSYTSDINVSDVILATESWGDMIDYNETLTGKTDHIVYPSLELNNKIIESANKHGLNINQQRVHCVSCFYNTKPIAEVTKHCNAKVCEMETYALFINANILGKRAAAVLTVSDNLVLKTNLDPHIRETGMSHIMDVILDVV